MTLTQPGGKKKRTKFLVFSITAIALTVAAAAPLAASLHRFAELRHRLENAAHMASVAAVSNLPAARKTAVAVLAVEGYAASTLTKLEYGLYDTGPLDVPHDNFKPITDWARANAVRLTVQIEAPLILGGIFTHRAVAFLINSSAAGFAERQE